MSDENEVKDNDSEQDREEKSKPNQFSSENQPKNRGRPKNIFGPLARANDLTNDDVKKIFKNLLTSRPEDLNKIIEKYPTVLTIATANILAQEMKGELTGRWEPTGRKIPELDGKGRPKTDKEGKIIMVDEVRPERKRSYEMVKYMIDRCFGKPIQTDIVLSSVSPETEKVIMRIFSSAKDESEQIQPTIIEPQIEYIEDEDE